MTPMLGILGVLGQSAALGFPERLWLLSREGRQGKDRVRLRAASVRGGAGARQERPGLSP